MRHRIVLTLLAFFPLCAFAKGNTSSSEDLKVTLKAEPGYKRQTRTVRTWSVYPTRRVVYEAPKAQGATTNNQALLTKTYVDPTQKRMPASMPKPVVAKQAVQPKAVASKSNIKVMKAVVAPKAPVAKAAVVKPVAETKPVTVATAPKTPVVDTVVQAPPAKTLVLEPMKFKVVKAKPVQKRQVSSFSPYEAGMAKVTRASSPKKSSGLVGRQKIASNK